MHFLGQGGRHSEEQHMVFHYGFFSRICSCLGLTLLFTSYVAPFWMVYYSPAPVNIGLWSVCTEKSCKEIVGSSDNLLIIRILMSLSVICGVLAVSLAFLTNTSRKKVKWPLITNLVSGLISLVTMLLFGVTMNPKHIYTDENYQHPNTYGWAFWLGCLGTFFFLMSGILYTLISLSDVQQVHSKAHMSQLKKEQCRAMT